MKRQIGRCAVALAVGAVMLTGCGRSTNSATAPIATSAATSVASGGAVAPTTVSIALRGTVAAIATIGAGSPAARATTTGAAMVYPGMPVAEIPTVGPAYCPGLNGSWLDARPITNWNHGGMAIPSALAERGAPQWSDQHGRPTLGNAPTNPQQQAVRDAGWRLHRNDQRLAGVAIVWG